MTKIYAPAKAKIGTETVYIDQDRYYSNVDDIRGVALCIANISEGLAKGWHIIGVDGDDNVLYVRVAKGKNQRED